MHLRRSELTYYSQFALLYAMLLAAAVLVVASQDNFALLSGSGYSSRSLNIVEIIIFTFYQYVLNFPFSAFNWFTDRYLYTTYYFLVPNSLAAAWLISKFLPYRKKDISQTLYYVLIVFGLVVSTIVSYQFANEVLK